MTTYDAIVVGARCGGSPTAMLLARKGYRVLLLDRATFPSDRPTAHFVGVASIAGLKRRICLDHSKLLEKPSRSMLAQCSTPLPSAKRPISTPLMLTVYRWVGGP